MRKFPPLPKRIPRFKLRRPQFMRPLRPLHTLTWRERVNFLVTNRVPRKALTHWMGWYSGIRSPRLTRTSIRIWRIFARDLNLTESKDQSFASLHDCFVRQLKDGAREVDRRDEIVASPCDAIVGACGNIEGTTVYQAKGFPYELGDLIRDANLREHYRDGVYVTLRLKSSMYHRFHAPVDCHVHEIDYVSGDTWNVNPPALKKIEKLYCRNERAIVPLYHAEGEPDITLVPVAAILVASMRFHALDPEINLRRQGSNRFLCQSSYSKGDEMGYFRHGSTIIVFATADYALYDPVESGVRIRMGEPLLINDNHSGATASCHIADL